MINAIWLVLICVVCVVSIRISARPCALMRHKPLKDGVPKGIRTPVAAVKGPKHHLIKQTLKMSLCSFCVVSI